MLPESGTWKQEPQNLLYPGLSKRSEQKIQTQVMSQETFAPSSLNDPRMKFWSQQKKDGGEIPRNVHHVPQICVIKLSSGHGFQWFSPGHRGCLVDALSGVPTSGDQVQL